jgi:hypothetical protein
MALWLRRFLADWEKLCNNLRMQSHKTSSSLIRRGETRNRATRRAFEAVRISSGLIAFYPQAIHRPQPYVILLDPVSGILRRLELQAEK